MKMGLGQTVSMMFNGSVERKEITKHPRLNFEKNSFSTAHIVLSSRWQSFSAPDLVQVDDLNERRFLEVFDMRVRQAAIRGWIYQLVKGNI